MRSFSTRITMAGAFAVAACVLCACGGGGTSNALTPPASLTTPPPPAPTPTPSPYPATDGTTFTYRGTFTQQYTLTGATPAPLPVDPSATPEPTSTPWIATTTQDVSQKVTVHANASFNGVTGLTEMEANETDTGQQSAYTIDSKQYVQFAPNAARSKGIDVTQVGSDASDSDGVDVTTTFANGNGIVDELPEVPASQWSNTASRAVVEKDPSGESISNTYAADGSYNATTSFAQGTNATITENPDGSGVYQWPFLGTPGSEVAISAVSNDAISITFKADAITSVTWGTIPVWYPNVPPVLASDAFIDKGTVSIPSSCNVPSSIGTQATQIDEQRLRVDSIYGELERTNQTSYVVPPYGAVCVVLHDDLQVYYDYSGQSSYLFSATPLRETVTDETLGLTGAPTTSSTVRRAASAFALSGVFLEPSTARVRLTAAKQHLQFVRRINSVINNKEAR